MYIYCHGECEPSTTSPVVSILQGAKGLVRSTSRIVVWQIRLFLLSS